MTDATQRRVVMPSPDLLYATCAFDVREHALRIRLSPEPYRPMGFGAHA